MKNNYEKVWIDITDYTVNNVSNVKKCDIKYRRDCGICYFIAEIDFDTGDTPINLITVDLPQMTDPFIPCENTILVSKSQNGEEMDTYVRLRLTPEHLYLTSYPFSANSSYELNIQLFMCLTNEKFASQYHDDKC